MLRSLTAAAAALGGAVALLAACAAPARAEPAMWVVRGQGSTVYLFGTVHVLRPDLKWKTPRLQAALASCADLTLEIANVDDAEAAAPTVRRYGFDAAHPLSARLTSTEQARLNAAAATLGLAPEQLNLMRPWLAGVALTIAPVVHAGYDPNSGVDRLVKADADARHEPVAGFETAESQIRLLATLPEAEQLDFLREALDDYDKAPVELDRLVTAWAEGRVDAIDREINDDMRKQSPALYRLLLVDRNEAFARAVKAMLSTAGTHCVAVGAGHLAGPDSVQTKLRALGVASALY